MCMSPWRLLWCTVGITILAKVMRLSPAFAQVQTHFHRYRISNFISDHPLRDQEFRYALPRRHMSDFRIVVTDKLRSINGMPNRIQLSGACKTRTHDYSHNIKH